MTHDQNKKTLRHFQCRDYLWEIFEQMSQELECSTDYLINEAMRQYARSRNYGTRQSSVPGMPRPPQASPQAVQAAPPPQQPAPPPPQQPAIPSLRGGGGGGRPPIPSAPPPPPHRSPSYGGGMPAAPPGPSHSGGGGGYGGYPQPPAPPAPQQRPSSYPPAAPSARPGPYGAPPPLPGRGAAGPSAAMPTLFVIFNGQKIPVNKHEFVIGRGSKTADLPIKDGNISRRHAVIVFDNGGFYMKDLGSTNGVEFHGQRVDTRLIQEGDVFQLCDYELRFTYR
jgi:hypothetical protein